MNALIFVVVNPACYPEFRVFASHKAAVSWLESEGFVMTASREIKASPRGRMFYNRGFEERVLFCREVEQ